ncbi:hypothetical protein QMG61_05170 [Cryobacterium sp. PH31-AA6]|uniref:hypothetical protein n=1 Tax=Cryobacterium sp. PH31-AA6 TaxID=3046205 RepID=UPI0024B931C5|nr:hypothetical protein [Cryobacterium sp. PH31-AA6]MDJ0323153.1 hypothetical protein [Cryobacterium sp. PH31-AA6]
MSTNITTAPISQAEYLQAEMGYLLRRLDDGDTAGAAASLATLRNELHKLTLGIDPGEEVCGRITTQNGEYYRWAFLDK